MAVGSTQALRPRASAAPKMSRARAPASAAAAAGIRSERLDVTRGELDVTQAFPPPMECECMLHVSHGGCEAGAHSLMSWWPLLSVPRPSTLGRRLRASAWRETLSRLQQRTYLLAFREAREADVGVGIVIEDEGAATHAAGRVTMRDKTTTKIPVAVCGRMLEAVLGLVAAPSNPY